MLVFPRDKFRDTRFEKENRQSPLNTEASQTHDSRNRRINDLCRVSSEMWLPEVRGVIWALYKAALYGI